LKGIFDLAEKTRLKNTLEEKSSQEGFWTLPQEERTTVLRELRYLESILAEWASITKNLDEFETGVDMMEEDPESGLTKELDALYNKVEAHLTSLEMKNLLGREHDEKNAIIMIHSGAGGTESADWVSMLYRMYKRWAEDHDFSLTEMDFLPGEEAGIRSVTFEVTGEYAYGYLKAEAGVHRLVRISPFDSAKRRHTSFASVFVYPDIDEDIDIEINEADLEIDTYRAQGAGGQHINTTDSAVRIRHVPSGIVVTCQNERSQHKNRSTAMKLLKAKLYDKRRLELEAEKDKKNALKQQIAWGSQIRSYVLHPYQLVKDHRTDVEVGNSQGVLDGNLDEFIHQALAKKVYV